MAGRYAALIRRGHRRLGGRLTTVRRASRLSGSSGASARGAGSQGSVSSGIRSPPVRVWALVSAAVGAERIERPHRGLRPRRLPLHHAPPIFRGAEHESLRSQCAGEPATGCVGLFFVATQVIVSPTQDLQVFQHRDLGSAVAHRRFDRLTVSRSTASASPAVRSNTAGW